MTDQAVTPQVETDETSANSAADFDLIIIGTGSGNSLIGPEMDSWRVALIERGVFGGTCLNRGCIPSKMLIYAADLAHGMQHAARFGVHGSFDHADWPAIRDRVFNRIDPIAEGGREYRLQNPNVTVFEGDARIVGEREVEVNGVRITGSRIVIAAGARSFIPDIPGLAESGYHTSDDIMRLEALPEHLIVMGGGFIAAELGYVFRSFGTKVTIINRSPHMMTAEDHDVAAGFTEQASSLFQLEMSAIVERVERTEAGVRVHIARSQHHRGRVVEGDALLVATGRRPNGDELVSPDAGIALGDDGRVIVDEFGRTSSPDVWALGDVNGRHQLKHMANGEAKVVRHNVLHPGDLRVLDTRPAPHAVFTSPQIGAVGPTEMQARQSGQPVCVITQAYGHAAYGWALEDTTSFCKLIGNPVTRTLIGAHVIGYQASMLVQLLVQGIHLGSTVDEMATGQIWIHPALSEVVEQALLTLIDEFDRYRPEVGTEY